MNKAERNLLAYLEKCIATPGDTGLVYEAQPQDDQAREDAMASCRIADLVDDYTFAVAQAGDLGGVELL